MLEYFMELRIASAIIIIAPAAKGKVFVDPMDLSIGRC